MRFGAVTMLAPFGMSWVAVFSSTTGRITANNFKCAIKRSHSPLFIWTTYLQQHHVQSALVKGPTVFWQEVYMVSV